MKNDTKPTENTAENGNKSKPLLQAVFLQNYISYGLKVQVESIDGKEISHLTGLIIKNGFEIAQISNTDYYLCSPEENDFSIKLILRELSDLKKDEFFDLYMDLCEEMESISCEYLLEALINKTKYDLDITKLEPLESWMYKNHFDWKYNLIEKGLAVSLRDVV